MQDRHREPLRALAATAAILAVTLSLALSAGLAYAAEDEEEDVPLDTKLFRQLMKDIGAQRDGPPIEYRERAPLVVPPSRNLPPPQDAERIRVLRRRDFAKRWNSNRAFISHYQTARIANIFPALNIENDLPLAEGACRPIRPLKNFLFQLHRMRFTTIG